MTAPRATPTGLTVAVLEKPEPGHLMPELGISARSAGTMLGPVQQVGDLELVNTNGTRLPSAFWGEPWQPP